MASSSSSFPVLVVTPERVDDAILASGLVRRLVDEIGHARFVIAANPAVAPLFRDVPGLDRLLVFEPDLAGMQWFALWSRARGRRWGLVLDLRGSRLSRFLRARRRAVKKPLPASAGPLHRVIEAARVLKLEDDPPAPYLFTSEQTEAKAASLLKPPPGGPQAPPETGPILALAPAADWVGKTWPAERFAVLAAELIAPNGPLADGRLLILGGPQDRWATETVRRATPRERLIDLVGKTDLLTAYACLKRARLFIGNDGPIMHLAAAAGTSTLGLFGPSDERIHGPWGADARALRGPRSYESIRAVDPRFSQAMNHMQDLTTAKVTAAARRLVADTEPEAAAEADAQANEAGDASA